jgi:hypothetical protein
MTLDDIIRLAREAGFTTDSVEVWIHDYDGICTSELERLAKLAYEAGAAAERERCAQLCRAMMPAEGVIRRTLLDLEREIGRSMK